MERLRISSKSYYQGFGGWILGRDIDPAMYEAINREFTRLNDHGIRKETVRENEGVWAHGEKDCTFADKVRLSDNF